MGRPHSTVIHVAMRLIERFQRLCAFVTLFSAGMIVAAVLASAAEMLLVGRVYRAPWRDPAALTLNTAMLFLPWALCGFLSIGFIRAGRSEPAPFLIGSRSLRIPLGGLAGLFFVLAAMTLVGGIVLGLVWLVYCFTHPEPMMALAGIMGIIHYAPLVLLTVAVFTIVGLVLLIRSERR